MASNSRCSLCEDGPSTVYCKDCREKFCEECVQALHFSGKRQNHVIVKLEAMGPTGPAYGPPAPSNHALVPSSRPSGFHSVTSSPVAQRGSSNNLAQPISQSYDFGGTREARGVATIRGVGLMLKEDVTGEVKVSGLAPDGAAARSSQIRVGDIIHEVDGKNVQGQPLSSFASMISGPEGTYVRIGFRSDSVSFIRRVTLQRTSPVNSSAGRDPGFDDRGYARGGAQNLGSGGFYGGGREESEPVPVLRDQLCGIGISFRANDSNCYCITGMVEGGPAFKSSAIEIGDVLYEIDGVMVLFGMDANRMTITENEVSEMLRGPAGSVVELVLLKGGHSNKKSRVKLRRERMSPTQHMITRARDFSEPSRSRTPPVRGPSPFRGDFPPANGGRTSPGFQPPRQPPPQQSQNFNGENATGGSAAQSRSRTPQRPNFYPAREGPGPNRHSAPRPSRQSMIDASDLNELGFSTIQDRNMQMRVSSLAPGSAAERQLEIGDVVFDIDGKSVYKMPPAALASAIQQVPPGNPINGTFHRDGRGLFRVRLVRDARLNSDRSERSGGGAGIGIVFKSDEASGIVRVGKLIRNAPADRTGMLMENDVVHEVNGKNVFRRPLAEWRNMIVGPEGSWLTLGVTPPGTKQIQRVRIMRAHFDDQNSVPSAAGPTAVLSPPSRHTSPARIDPPQSSPRSEIGAPPPKSTLGVHFTLDRHGRVVVGDLVPGGPCDRTGSIEVGDILRTLNGRDITGLPMQTWALPISQGPPGTAVTMGLHKPYKRPTDTYTATVIRDPVSVSRPPSRPASPPHQPRRSTIGINFEHDALTSLVSISSVIPNGPAARAGVISIGDVVKCVEGRDVYGVAIPIWAHLVTDGAPGTIVSLELIRAHTGETYIVQIQRESTQPDQNSATAAPDLQKFQQQILEKNSMKKNGLPPPPAAGVCGVGIVPKVYEGQIVVSALYENGPALRSNIIRVGDVLAEINDYKVRNLTVQKFLELFYGPDSTAVKLGLKKRFAFGTKHVTLVREGPPIEPPPALPTPGGSEYLHREIREIDELPSAAMNEAIARAIHTLKNENPLLLAIRSESVASLPERDTPPFSDARARPQSVFQPGSSFSPAPLSTQNVIPPRPAVGQQPPVQSRPPPTILPASGPPPGVPPLDLSKLNLNQSPQHPQHSFQQMQQQKSFDQMPAQNGQKSTSFAPYSGVLSDYQSEPQTFPAPQPKQPQSQQYPPATPERPSSSSYPRPSNSPQGAHSQQQQQQQQQGAFSPQPQQQQAAYSQPQQSYPQQQQQQPRPSSPAQSQYPPFQSYQPTTDSQYNNQPHSYQQPPTPSYQPPAPAPAPAAYQYQPPAPSYQPPAPAPAQAPTSYQQNPVPSYQNPAPSYQPPAPAPAPAPYEAYQPQSQINPFQAPAPAPAFQPPTPMFQAPTPAPAPAPAQSYQPYQPPAQGPPSNFQPPPSAQQQQFQPQPPAPAYPQPPAPNPSFQPPAPAPAQFSPPKPTPSNAPAGSNEDDESTLVLQDGTSVAAGEIEANVLRCIPAIEHVMVVGSGRPKLCAILTLKTNGPNGQLAPPALALASKGGSSATTVAEAKKDATFRRALLQEFAAANANAASPSRKLNRFSILADQLSVGAGTLNGDGSINRLRLKQKNQAVIDGMYK